MLGGVMHTVTGFRPGFYMMPCQAGPYCWAQQQIHLATLACHTVQRPVQQPWRGTLMSRL